MTESLQTLKAYDTWLFDCDGVLLDSNAVKTEAFFQAALPYGKANAEALVKHHVENGGISRYRKFEYFFGTILERSDYEEDYGKALRDFAAEAREGLLDCSEVPGARDFLEEVKKRSQRLVAVVSGSDEAELKDVFKARGLLPYFDAVRGSPAAKEDIVAGLLAQTQADPKRCVLFGDSRADYRAAEKFGIDFVMIYGYSEWKSWREEARHCAHVAPDFSRLRVA